MFTESFYALRSQKRKNSVKLSVSFALLGSAHVKSAQKALKELPPGLNFINDLRTAFTLVDPESGKNTVKS